MSKEAAMSMLTGTPAPEATPASPGLTPAVETQLKLDAAAPKELDSSRFAHLARKEAEFVKQRQAFKAEQESILAEKAKVQEAQKKLQEYEEMKKTDPVAALKRLGFSETDIFNYMAANEKKDPTPEERAIQVATEAAESKIKAFEEAQAKRVSDEQSAQDTKLIENFKGGISSVIKANAEKYEYSAFYGKEAEELAYELTKEVVKQSKGAEVLTPEEAVKMAEEFFEMRDQEMSKLKKRQPKAPEAPAAPAKTEPTRTRTVDTSNAPSTKPRTLSNSASATIASTRTQFNESRAEKRERLMQALKDGKLN